MTCNAPRKPMTRISTLTGEVLNDEPVITQTYSVPQYEKSHPFHCCSKCGENIGILGRLFGFHKCKEEITAKEAVDKLIKELKDPSYYISWNATIAMAFQDEAYRQKSRDSRKKLHEISNKAADNFLASLMYVPSGDKPKDLDEGTYRGNLKDVKTSPKPSASPYGPPPPPPMKKSVVFVKEVV